MPIPPWKNEPVSFARFMQWCLYDPEIGYYRRGRKIFGPEGDYYTSSYTHPAFAQVVARFISGRLDALGQGPFQLVEPGAGEQRLGRGVIDWLRAERPDLASRTTYHPLEAASPDPPPAIRGVVFSNEFFDALPVHRVRVRGSGLKEIFVVWREGRFEETERDVSDPRIEDYMSDAFPHRRDGWVYEVNLKALEFLERLDRCILAATVLTIDYGFTAREYESRPRPEGTLLCYRGHQAHADPYRDIGGQDLTAHVPFDVLVTRGRKLGWTDLPLRSQREFLMENGLSELLREEEAAGWFNPSRTQDRLDLRRLLEPGGVSDTMKVLVQSKT